MSRRLNRLPSLLAQCLLLRACMRAKRPKVGFFTGVSRSYCTTENDDGFTSVILELRPAAGGDEAQIFCMDVFRMYQSYAELKKWKFDVVTLRDEAFAGSRGCREATIVVQGDNVYRRLKWESGVHRVQRVPATEKSGRTQTSTMTVAVLPEPKEVDVKLNDKDIRVDTFRSSGPGGQSVNKTESAVRLTHLPTGITVSIQNEKSQHSNKSRAMQILRARLLERERAKADEERTAARREQIGRGDRSERIRTYNFSQNRVTDHRIGLTLHGIESFMNGELLDDLLDALEEKGVTDVAKSDDDDDEEKRKKLLKRERRQQKEQQRAAIDLDML